MNRRSILKTLGTSSLISLFPHSVIGKVEVDDNIRKKRWQKSKSSGVRGVSGPISASGGVVDLHSKTNGNVEWTKDIVSSTPDISMFSSPIYQFHAASSGLSDGQVGSFPEVYGGLGSTTVQDNPTYRTDYQGTGFNMFVYDDGADGTIDEHNIAPDDLFPSDGGQISVFGTFYSLQEGSGNAQTMVGFRTNNDVSIGYQKGGFGVGVTGSNSFGSGSWVINRVTTMGFTYDDSTGASEIFGDGSDLADNSTSFSLSSISELEIGGGNYGPFDGGIFEVVICDTVESFSNYQTYHNNRV